MKINKVVISQAWVCKNCQKFVHPWVWACPTCTPKLLCPTKYEHIGDPCDLKAKSR